MSDLRSAPTAGPSETPALAPVADGGTEIEANLIEPGPGSSIRPFEFHASDEDLADLKRRILATRWPERETVNDDSQGVQLATAQKLAYYWAHDYDWRKCEARLNALPNFITEIDGSTERRKAGLAALLRTSSISTPPTGAATSPPGSMRSSSPEK